MVFLEVAWIHILFVGTIVVVEAQVGVFHCCGSLDCLNQQFGISLHVTIGLDAHIQCPVVHNSHSGVLQLESMGLPSMAWFLAFSQP